MEPGRAVEDNTEKTKQLDSHHNPKVKETSEEGNVGRQTRGVFICQLCCLSSDRVRPHRRVGSMIEAERVELRAGKRVRFTIAWACMNKSNKLLITANHLILALVS